MKAFVITLSDNPYSVQVADRCIASAHEHGLTVGRFEGVNANNAEQTMASYGLKWSWANGNESESTCPVTGLHQFPYRTADLRFKIGCSMSHFLLYQHCVDINEPILILEHDAVFLRPLPNFDFKGICQINDPAGCTRRGSWWSQQLIKRGKPGAFDKTWVTAENERLIPDGLAGNSAYVIKPWAAKEVIDKYYELGVWPNDAILCKQIFPYLEEYYPFITKVVQTKSTTIGK